MSVDPRKIDSLFRAQTRPELPGYAVGVMRDGDIVHANGYGMADVEHGVPITPATVFHVASLSKQFTACAVLRLEADNKLSLNDGVRTHLPEVGPFADRITLEHLLHHTSGLRDQWPLLRLLGWREMDERSEDDALDLVRGAHKLNFPPGKDFTYCSTGYTLLAVIVKRVSGKSLRDFSAARIFEPLGMDATRFRDDHTESIAGRAHGYKPPDDDGLPRFWVPNFDLAGPTSLHTTVEDLLRWAGNLMAPRAGFARIVEALLRPGMLTDDGRLGYGAGVGLGHHRGLAIVRHSGWDLGYVAHLAVYPTERFAVAVLGNLSTLTPWLMARKVAELCLEGRFPEAPADPIDLPEDELAGKAGLYRHRRNGRVLWVNRSGGVLLLGPDGPPRSASVSPSGMRLRPLDATTFVGTDETTEVVFNGRTMAIHGEFGVEELFDRVGFSRPAAAALAAYAATYRCPELDATLTVSVGPGGLVAKQRKWPPRALSPAYKDAFNDDKTTYVFTRNGSDAVDGVTLSLERVHNLRFDRV